MFENQGFLLKAGKYLMTERFNDKKTYQSLSINFANDVLSKLLPQIEFNPEGEKYLHILKISQSPLIDIFLSSLHTYFHMQSKEIDWNALLEMKLNELFLILLNSIEKKDFLIFIKSLHSKNKISLEVLMENHFKEDLSISELAFLAGLSISTFKRKFENEMKITPHHWIQRRRLQEARHLLKAPDKNISDICFECGFENLSHFIRLFKANFNQTPLQFRNELLRT